MRAEAVRPAGMGRLAAAAVLATTLEWFDFMVYSTAAALVFGSVFFPDFSGVAGTLAAFATFAVGFLARPLGGVVAGHLGDRLGRKPPLVGAMVIMGVATFGIGLLPGYDAIGAWAPLALVALRLLQGIGVGAQWGGAALLLTEHAPAHRRGYYGSFIQVGSILGAVTGNAFFLALVAGMSDAQFQNWGWRVPFLSGLLLVAIGIYVQLKIEDTPVFLAMRRESAAGTARRSPLGVALRRYWREILQAAGAFFVVNGTFYVLISGMLDYGTEYAGLSRTTVLLCVLCAGATQIVTIPFFGSYSDRRGRRKPFLVGAVLMAAFAFPLFWLVGSGSIPLVLVGLVVAFTIHAVMFGPQAALFAEMFPADVRYSGASLGFQLASIFAGGLAPFIMTALLAVSGPWSVSLYIVAMAALTFAAVFTVQERFRRDLHETSEQVRETGGVAP